MEIRRLLTIFVTFISYFKLVKCDCGIPTQPEGIEYKPDSADTIFKEGTKLTGNCINSTHRLVTFDKFHFYSTYDKKSSEIVCTLGSWQGSFGRCAIPLSTFNEPANEPPQKSKINKIDYYKGFVNISDFVEGNLKDPQLTETFENMRTLSPHCIDRPDQQGKFSHNSTWIFDLKFKSTVAYVSFNLASNDQINKEVFSTENPFISVFLNDIRDCKIHSSTIIGGNREGFIDFLCELVDPEGYDSNLDIIESVLVTFNYLKRPQSHIVSSVCFWDFHKSCGISEIPSDNRGFATPRCLPDGVWDYFLQEPLSHCVLPINDTYIHGNTFTLEDGGVAQYVNAKYYNQTLFAVPYTIEIYSCDDRVVGTRMCTEDGEWDSEPFTCSGSLSSVTLPPMFTLITFCFTLIKHIAVLK